MLHNADCFDVIESLPDNSVDAVITDPPYGTTSIEWDTMLNPERFWRQIKRVMRTEKSPIIVFADQPFTSALVMSNLSWFRHDFIWKKPQHSGAHNARKRPFKYTEDILVFSESPSNYYYEQVCTKLDKPKTIKYNLAGVPSLGKHKEEPEDHTTYLTGFPKEVLEFTGVRKGDADSTGHPTQKPVDLLEYLINLYSKEGDVIFDPFMGSGSTGVACNNLNREFIGVEMKEDFYNLAVSRVKDLTLTPKTGIIEA
jgi:site-specific DNA-methyltransferase (adenine-specific)